MTGDPPGRQTARWPRRPRCQVARWLHPGTLTFVHVALVHNLQKTFAEVVVPLANALAANGATVEVIAGWELRATVDSQAGVVIRRPDGTVFAPDVVCTRVLNSAPLRSVMLAVAATGTPVVNDPQRGIDAGDKLVTSLTLAAAGVPIVPTTVLADTSWKSKVGQWPYPVVAKPARGSQGKRVTRVASDGELAVAATQQGDKELWIGQPMVQGPLPGDIRVLVVAGEAIAAVHRIPGAGDWRGNVHAGATPAHYPLTATLGHLAQAAAQACGLVVAGVGVIMANDGPAVLEVNPNPDLAIMDVTGVDVRAAVAAAVVAPPARKSSQVPRINPSQVPGVGYDAGAGSRIVAHWTAPLDDLGE